MPDAPTKTIEPAVLALLRCPLTRSTLTQQGDWLVADQPEGAGLRYPIRDGIPVLLMDQATLPQGVGSLDEFKAKYQISSDT
ncbi:MAG: Trm112 family protein [Phycisphaeraceae bacterium]